jgi:hypothetical protein
MTTYSGRKMNKSSTNRNKYDSSDEYSG